MLYLTLGMMLQGAYGVGGVGALLAGLLGAFSNILSACGSVHAACCHLIEKPGSWNCKSGADLHLSKG